MRLKELRHIEATSTERQLFAQVEAEGSCHFHESDDTTAFAIVTLCLPPVSNAR